MAAAAEPLLPISAVIITKNEADRIGRCLASLRFAAEVIVVDSGSTDGTVELATSLGARVVHHDWLGYGPQKNYAISLATQPWTLSIDADEEVTPALAQALRQRLGEEVPPRVAGFRMRRQLVFAGRRLRFGRSVNYPVRLFRTHCGTFDAVTIHESLRVDGDVASLRGTLLHHSYRSLSDYLTTLNSFTSLTAQDKAARGCRVPRGYALRLPWEIFHRYFLRLGVLDGRPGLQWCLLSAFYVYVKYAKLDELLSRPRQADAPQRR
ncbi:MAG: glycosyltransferase family 2 protein [Candidatus Schekmanbacteria bacterium]|nr:glycosyltransferase family 2 protein [Candidatus Schekmanbacteria bacterium]